MAGKSMEQGRHFKGANPAPGAKKVFTSGDSGGKIFNPVQKPKSNSLAAASTPPFLPDTAAVATKKPKFYGK